MAWNKIWLGPVDGANHKPLIVEGIAGAGIFPGMAVTYSNGAVAVSANDGTTQERLLVAREVGENFGVTIAEAWTTGVTCAAVQPRDGEFIAVRLAAAQTVELGSALCRDGNGNFKVCAGGDVPVVYAAQASDGAAVGTLIKVSVDKA